VSERVVVIDYTNWRGRREKRTIRPRWLWFGSTEYHPEPQWLLCAFDRDKEADRDFAMSGIHSWSAPEPAGRAALAAEGDQT
jgi:predicted DNA-binding transcriptional regulator YafY